MACDAGRFGRLVRYQPEVRLLVFAENFPRPSADRYPDLGPADLRSARHSQIASIRLSIGDYRRYGLQRPNHKIFERHPAFGTDLLNAIRLGRVKPRPAIDHVDGKTVTFVDGTSGDLRHDRCGDGISYLVPVSCRMVWSKSKHGIVQVYGGAFPPGVRGLYIVGWAQARNGFGRLITPLADLYARMIALQDELEFPLGSLMEQSIHAAPADDTPRRSRKGAPRDPHRPLDFAAAEISRPSHGAETKTQGGENRTTARA